MAVVISTIALTLRVSGGEGVNDFGAAVMYINHLGYRENGNKGLTGLYCTCRCE